MNTISLFSREFTQYGCYVLVYLASLFEASPLFGFLIPGQTLVIAGGFLAKTGVFNIFWLIGVASAGAITGDFIGYWLGLRYGDALLIKYGKYLFFKEEYLFKTKEFMKNHTGKTLIIGRFNSITRAFAPFVAGSSNIPFRKFLFYNIIGGISWGICFVLIGYLFGQGYELVSKYIGRIVFFGILVSILIIYAYRFINKKRHIFEKYHLYTLTLNITSLYLFSKMIEDVLDNETIVRWDIFINAKIAILQNPLITKWIVLFTNVFSPISMLIASIIAILYLVIEKRWHIAFLWTIGLLGGEFFQSAIKLIIQRPRPSNALIYLSSFSFPSGHATLSVIFFSCLAYLIGKTVKNRFLKILAVSVCMILTLMVGLSRIYLNVHYLSDVIAGFSLGLFWFTLLILVIHYFRMYFDGSPMKISFSEIKEHNTIHVAQKKIQSRKEFL